MSDAGRSPARTALEPRYPCPVCLGALMDKVQPGADGRLVLDRCPRCGGVWFEAGELARTQAVGRDVAWPLIAPPTRAGPALCHACGTPVNRDAPACAACGHTQQLGCPRCAHDMRVLLKDGLRLDACDGCRGVWFDRHELIRIWHAGAATAAGGPRAAVREAAGDAPLALIEGLLWAPDLAALGMHAAATGAAGAAEIAAGTAGIAAGAAGTAAEAAADAAGSVFAALAEIVGGIFG